MVSAQCLGEQTEAEESSQPQGVPTYGRERVMRDMSTAPKTGCFLGWIPGYGWQIVWWTPGGLSRSAGWEWHSYELSKRYAPIAWAPLPDEPAEGSE